METRNVVKTVITISYKMIIFALVVILIYYAGGAAFRFGVSVFNESSMSDPSMARTKTVTIPDNPSIEDVHRHLTRQSLLTEHCFSEFRLHCLITVSISWEVPLNSIRE